MTFPPQFERLWAQPNVKAAFVSTLTSPKKFDCLNCGGAGIMTTFVAIGGPFLNPPVGKDIVAYFDTGAKKWWAGTFYSCKCPVCDGSGRQAGKDNLPRLTATEYKELIDSRGDGIIRKDLE